MACINSPESVKISGDILAVTWLLDILQGNKVFARKLDTGGQAYHSYHMKTLRQESENLLKRALTCLNPSYSLLTEAMFISSVTAEPRSSDVDPAYWRSNLESLVLFVHTVVRLSKEGGFHLIEIGPHSALEMPIKQIHFKLSVAEDKLPYPTAIKRHANAAECVLSLAGSL